jgi:hypothetical protein
VAKGNIWFHVDGEEGASFWSTGKNYDQLVLEVGIVHLDSDVASEIPVANIPDTKGEEKKDELLDQLDQLLQEQESKVNEEEPNAPLLPFPKQSCQSGVIPELKVLKVEINTDVTIVATRLPKDRQELVQALSVGKQVEMVPNDVTI